MKNQNWLVLVLILAGILLIRMNQGRIPSPVRYFNKAVLNKLMMAIAGVRYSPISIVRHAGRKSGKRYETPLIVAPYRSGFAFALTYGPDVDWYRNVLAAGECGLRWQGREFTLEQPELLAVEDGRQAFPAPARIILQTVGISDFFWMQIREESVAPGAIHAG